MPRILIVDDSEAQGLLTKLTLDEVLPEAEIHNTGASRTEFEADLRHGPFDLLIIDRHLGWADGFDLIDEVRHASPGCGVIMYSGVPPPVSRKGAPEVRFVAKDGDPRQLAALARQLI
jgi:DNA-binding response OmpR family regulator